jgi:hypothetical protein
MRRLASEGWDTISATVWCLEDMYICVYKYIKTQSTKLAKYRGKVNTVFQQLNCSSTVTTAALYNSRDY